MLVTFARIMAKPWRLEKKQAELIQFAEVLAGAHKDETSADIEEAELDEVWI
jgi:hypothetical protein